MMQRLIFPFLLLLSLLFSCKEPPAVEILIVDEETGLPISDAEVFIRKKLVGTSDADGIVSIVTTQRKNVQLSVEKSEFFPRKIKAKNLGLIDRIKLQKRPSHSLRHSGTNRTIVDEEYNDFLESLKTIDVDKLPDGCDYLDGKYSREASFPGGSRELQQFIVNNVQYPKEAIDMDEQGKVYLSFVVSSDGQINNIKVERGVSKSLDREAKRIMRAMPNWNPGHCNGRKVSTRCRLPIVFTLN